ncbi:alpha/beta hydrolase [Actinomycetospora termitidis]|uniref:Alpha/beta-hydrolase family protein n=1 Tax=Actinomycetospora termitidis TaxID=3053470 RepID=A0ABT7M6U6_9PSEU|nr:alpha/beta-hydrolase family protein [Actinomycetospora sp. Odt1-22]MDL5156365.1 alpha/beta-hydrolase family protein [Actinomycetospora sp. Odt1-22]
MTDTGVETEPSRDLHGPGPRPPAAHVVHRGPGPLDRPGLRWLRVDALGLAVAVAFGALAMTPSLIPRDWVVQGLATGLSAAVGYGVGTTVWFLIRRTRTGLRLFARARRHIPPRVRLVAWPILLVAAVVVVLVMLVAGVQWQRQLALLVGIEPPTLLGYARALPLGVLVAAAPIAVVRLVRHADHVLVRGLRRFTHLPRRIAGAVAVVLLAMVIAAVLNQIVLPGTLTVVDQAFSGVNEQTYPGFERPTGPTRSGSPDSLVPWETLGKEGRRFVAAGRDARTLAEASGRPAVEPVRAYVGLESAPDAQARADLAVRELDREGAFSRDVVAVVTTTGTGWVDDPVSDSLEAIYGGDTAMVATQYSYLPSWLSFLFDGPRAEEAGRLLIDAVHARIDAIPPGQPRPRMIVFGESLGSQGSEGAFSSLADVRANTDGALWVGPPNSNRLWSQIVDRRDPGSPEVRPTYSDGLVVRFAGGGSTATVGQDPASPWLPPHVLYLQHPSDPVVWWSPSLLWERPDWLVEPRGSDVVGAMSWYPVITFWQVSIDLVNAVDVPPGHGHVYQGEVLDGWVAVAAPPGWTAADTERVREVLAR